MNYAHVRELVQGRAVCTRAEARGLLEALRRDYQALEPEARGNIKMLLLAFANTRPLDELALVGSEK
jgi:hypothetical protein